MKLVRDYLDGTCEEHTGKIRTYPMGYTETPRTRWECAPCLLEMLPRLRGAIRATCVWCRKGMSFDQHEFGGPLDLPHYHGNNHTCTARDLRVLSAEIWIRLRGEAP